MLHLYVSVYKSFVLPLGVSVYKSLLHLCVSVSKSLCYTCACLSTCKSFVVLHLCVSVYMQELCAAPGRV